MKKTISVFLYLMIVTGMIFNGCSRTKDDVVIETDNIEEEVVVEEPVEEVVVEEPVPPLIEEAVEEVVEATTVYADGSYSASGSYQSPAGSESISVTLVVKDDKVSSLSVVSNAINATSQNYQGKFVSGINSLVVGQSIEELGSFSQVNGSSLTPSAFNQALNNIKSQALI